MNRTDLLATTLFTCVSLTACNSMSTSADTGSPMDSGDATDIGGSIDSGGSPDSAHPDTAATDAPSPTDTPPPDAGVSATQACTDLAMARCTMLDMCSGSLGVVRDFGDMATCVRRYVTNCMTTLSVAMSSATPAFDEACAVGLMSESCSDFRDGFTEPACITPAGPLANGMPCVTSAQCQSTVCLLPNDSQCGTCSPQPTAGADCAVTGCGRNLACNHNATAGTYTCRVPITSGNACDADHPCAGGLDCVLPSTTATSGTCTQLAAGLGLPCSRNSVTTPACDSYLGLFCTTSHVCAADTASTTGEPCGLATGGAGAAYCINGGTCSSGAGGATRMCVAVSTDGSPCNNAAAMQCLTPARCIQSAGPDAGPDAGTGGTCLTLNPTACP